MRWNRRAPYTQEEIAEQIRQIGDLKQQLDNTSQSREVVQIAREVLAFMLDEVVAYNAKYENRTSV